jgi:hypothetical protein
MRRGPLLGLAAAVTAVAVVGVQAAGAWRPPGPPPVPGVRTVAQCPDGPVAVTDRPVPLVADLGRVQVRESASRAALLAAADQVLAGTIPVVKPRPVQGEDHLRYLYDAGVALRRVVGVLGYAYAATHDQRYRDALAAQTVGAARWGDWNPGHPLDTAQVGTAVALGYAWSRERMTPAEREEVLAALATRLVTPYVCGSGGLAGRRVAEGNQATVVGTAVVLAGLAARGSAGWSDAAVRAGSIALARHATADGSGHSLVDGPTVEGLMYTNYEAASVALLDATARVAGRGSRGAPPLVGPLPPLDGLAAWNEHCGRVVEPAVQDGWDLYPWVDRTTALADMARSPQAGPRLAALYEAMQLRGRLTLPGLGEWAVPDGIAELVMSQLTPGAAPPGPPPDRYAAGGPATARLYGCATYGDTYALMTAVPNDAAHAHADVGNVVVKQGEQTLLDDLGQRSYTFTADGPVWRAATEAHSTIGVAQPDGSVLQRRSGSGSVTVDGGDLVMTSTTALPGVASWQRRVTTGDGIVRVRDDVTPAGGGDVPLSLSFLLATPPSSVVQQPDGSLRFTVADGSAWLLVPPAGTTATVTDASPQPPYVDGPDLAPSAAAHTLVVLRCDITGSTALATELRRADPAVTQETAPPPAG